jgi:hypothetical protein
VAELEKRIGRLEEMNFVVVDDDTEELLIRSFVRNDGVWRMPKVMGAMVSGALEISSKRLQQALLDEMARIPLDDLSDDPAKLRTGGEGPSIRQQVRDHIETLRRAFGTPTPDPSGRGSVTPSDTPSGTPSDTPAERGPKASTRAHAGPHVRAAPAPAPTPAPDPSPVQEVGGVPGDQSEAGSAIEVSRPVGLAPIDVDGFSITDTMRRWVAATYPGFDIEHATAQFVSHYRSTGARRKSWPDAWQKWIRDDAKKAADRQQRFASNVVQLPSGQTLTGTDATVAGWAALAADLDTEDSA